jgi:hypothetical protein
MSRGLGRVQRGCLAAIAKYEEAGDKPTTYDIVAAVYQIEPNADDYHPISDAQHAAVRRALEGLERKGHVVGLYLSCARSPRDGRAERCHHWFSRTGAAKYLADLLETITSPLASHTKQDQSA